MDGTSNTILYVEVLGHRANGTLDYAFTWMGRGEMPMAWYLPKPTSKPGWYQPESLHSGVVQVSLCDGSVRAIRESVNDNEFLYLAAISDGHKTLQGVLDGREENQGQR